MTKPSESALFQKTVDAVHVGKPQYFVIGDFVMPFNSEDES